MVVVALFQPEIKGENLTANEQLNEIIGPFTNEDEAMNWISRFQEWAIDNQYVYSIQELSAPPERI